MKRINLVCTRMEEILMTNNTDKQFRFYFAQDLSEGRKDVLLEIGEVFTLVTRNTKDFEVGGYYFIDIGVR